MKSMEIHRLLADLGESTGDREWQLLPVLFGQAVQPTYDFIHAFRRPPDANAKQLVAIVYLVHRSLSDLIAGGHLATHRYLPQTYSVLRPVLDASDLIQLFTTDAAAAETWVSTTEAHKKFTPSDVRKRLGRPQYDRIHGLLSELGPHPRFSGARMNLALEKLEEPDEISTTAFTIGPAPMWHPSTLWAWRFAFETVFRLTEATLDVTTLAADVDSAIDTWLRGQLRCIDAVRGGTLLVLRRLGEDVAADEATYSEMSERLRALLESDGC